MLLRRIEVTNFRKLAGPVVIDALADGVTVIAGDNEEGKSTLLDAIRTGLFERHNLTGKAVDAMQPFGSSVRPQVRLDFEIDGAAYRIEKGFAQKPAALLETPSGRFEGAAAEERLAELLTFRVPQRGESKPDDRGVLGLFWLEQGRAPEGLAFGETGRSTLRGSLEDEVGDVLGGSHGRALLAAAREQRDALLTGTGRPRTGGALAGAIARALETSTRVAALETERAAYDDEIDALARARRDLAQIDADRVLEQARDALARAAAELRSIDGLRQADQEAGRDLQIATARLQNAEGQWSTRQGLLESVTKREQAASAAAQEPAALERRAADLAARVDAAQAALADAVARRTAAEARVNQARTAERLGALEREIDGIAVRMRQVDGLAARRAAARERVDAIEIDRARFDELQRLDAAVGRDRAALEAVATRLRFLPEGHRAVTRDGVPVPPGEVTQVTGPTRFRLDGFGTVEVEPGAADLADRRARYEQVHDTFRTLLAAVASADLADAKARLDARTAAEAEVQETARLVAAHAPEGVDALHAAHAERVAQRERLREGVDPAATAGLADPDSEQRALTTARTAEDAARAALDAARRVHQENGEALATAREAARSTTENLAAARHDLAAAREKTGDADLAAALENARRAVADATAAKERSTARLEAANPEEAELRRKGAEDALESVQAEQRRLRDQVIQLESRLGALGKDGIGEQLDEARGAAAQAAAQRDRLQADADAWQLLVTTLTDAERDAKEAFLEPVLRRVEPFLRLILPDARVTLDEETLEITGVHRDGRSEPYDALSVGTREQLSILVRLAFAVYLRERGFPATVILDDALVYADDERFERMQLALRKAAASVQILILTCRPRDWRQFGAPIRRLAHARSGAGQER